MKTINIHTCSRYHARRAARDDAVQAHADSSRDAARVCDSVFDRHGWHGDAGYDPEACLEATCVYDVTCREIDRRYQAALDEIDVAFA